MIHSHLGYRPEIDGLRALAVVAVVLFHCGIGLTGGFIGVDVFFVLSGFLITGIIQRGLETDTFSFAEFWERRIRRIFPAVFVMLVAVLGVGYRLLLPNELEDLGKSSIAQVFFAANFYFWRDTGYFAGPAEFKPLLHMWSLAIEEQFYLFFPIALCLLKRLDRTSLFIVLTIAMLFSFGASVYGVMFYPNAAFFLLPTRAWELLCGCMLAVFPWKCAPSPQRDHVISVIASAAIVIPMFIYSSTTPTPGLAALPPVLGTAAIIFVSANTPGIWLSKLLSLRPVVFIGLISYSLYLWHWPIFVYTRTYFGHFGWAEIFFASIGALSLATLSWRFVETPLRRSAFRNRGRSFGSAFLLSSAVAGLSLFVMHDSATWRLPEDLLLDVKWNGSEYVREFRNELGIASNDLKSLGVRSERSDNGEIDFVVWGDSHGMVCCKCLDDLASDFRLHGKAILQPGFAPLPFLVRTDQDQAYQVETRRKIMEFLESSRPRNLILICRWSRYMGEKDVDEPPFRISDSRSDYPRGEDPVIVLSRNLMDLAQFCFNRRIRLWVFKQVPQTGESSPAKEYLAFALGRRHRLSNQQRSYEQHRQQQAKCEMAFEALAGESIHFIDPAPHFVDVNGMTINYRNGRSLYCDNDHLTQAGAEHLRLVFHEMLREMSDRKSEIEMGRVRSEDSSDD